MTYPAGARVLAGALKELRLIYDDESEAELQAQLRVGQVIFAAPDIDFGLMRDHYADGFAELATQVTVYTTKRDNPLGISGGLFAGNRLGAVEARGFPPGAIRYLQE